MSSTSWSARPRTGGWLGTYGSCWTKAAHAYASLRLRAHVGLTSSSWQDPHAKTCRPPDRR
eukprot:1425975-Alexandrium_andersonii.AAC.1